MAFANFNQPPSGGSLLTPNAQNNMLNMMVQPSPAFGSSSAPSGVNPGSFGSQSNPPAPQFTTTVIDGVEYVTMP